MLDDITPVILTYNEAPNIGRVLERLTWANRIVVVDSYSSDETLSIAEEFSNSEVFKRKFDTHASQWNYAINETGISTDWILALDSDYVLTDEFVSELDKLQLTDKITGYKANFVYCVNGKPLRGTLYVPVTVLYRRSGALYEQDGHTQRILFSGIVGQLESKILHDDRKPLSRWLWAQGRYMSIEADMISTSSWSDLTFTDKIRKLIFVAPLATLFYCLVIKGGLLDGWAGFYYAIQRTVAESILSLKLIEKHIHGK
jgi:glycosyltransferase involved in cell wall biosynthesis